VCRRKGYLLSTIAYEKLDADIVRKEIMSKKGVFNLELILKRSIGFHHLWVWASPNVCKGLSVPIPEKATMYEK
jgi:hypothetical protein